MPANDDLLILGGSHSAYSVAGAFLELPGAERLAKGQIVILRRRKPRISIPIGTPRSTIDTTSRPATSARARSGSTAWAACAGSAARRGVRSLAGQHDIRAARRHPGHAAPDDRPAQHHDRGGCAGRAILRLPAAMLPVFDQEGARLTLNAELGGVAVGERSQLLLSDGACLDNLFGIELGRRLQAAGHHRR